MSAQNNVVEWVGGEIEEVTITEESLPPETNTQTVLEPVETPIQKLLDSVGEGENQEGDQGFCCEECLALFEDQSDPDNLNGPSFILDYPTDMGVAQRALLSLPFGLTVGRSSIPNAGVGVINHGPALSPGMHFGPYEGYVTTKENASHFSWEIYKDKDQYEYIDGVKESHSNWMRYVNCARTKDESNLLAVQYKDSILFHCCRSVQTEEELLVWPSSKILNHCSQDWRQIWLLKVSATETNTSGPSQIYLCSHCPLSFTTESFLLRHTENCHLRPKAPENTDLASNAISEPAAEAVVILSADLVKSKTCSDCGKVFKQIPHLRRHQLCVHSNKRPYCCPHCRRSFSQASGLIRHQLLHRKHGAVKTAIQSRIGESEHLNPAASCEETDKTMQIEDQPEDTDGTGSVSAGEAQTSQSNCSDCGKSFTNEASLKKHKATVHERLRPYVCTVCQKCFGQYTDLTRHLRCHKRQNINKEEVNEELKDPAKTSFSCNECSRTFPSLKLLLQHTDEHQSEVESPRDDSESVNVAAENVPSKRPQRLGARIKVSALTKLLAPKQRANRREAPLNGTKSQKLCCDLCKETFVGQDGLKEHKCPLRQHKCEQCGATFNKSAFLKRHEQTAHEEEKLYSCDRCGKSFATSGNLRQHQKSNTCMKYHCSSELFSCSFCQFSFTAKSYLLKHVKRHHPAEYLAHCESDGIMDPLDEREDEGGKESGGKDYTCTHCGKQCANSKALSAHTCFRQMKVLYLCTDCGKGFSNHYGLKQHQRIHTGEKPYCCPHCTKSFSYVGQLNVHLRTHTGEKPYLCTHCGESFRQSGDLKRHERKHTGVRPHNCTQCSKSFSRPQSLRAHQMLHQGQRMFKCSQCGRSFSRNYHLRRHHQKAHS